jgi:hypothetical protein
MTLKETRGVGDPHFGAMEPQLLFCLEILELEVSGRHDRTDTFLLRVCIRLTMESIEAIVSSGDVVPSWAFCVASLRLAVMAFVSLSMLR